MGTKLGAVEIPIKLDFSGAEQQIQRFAAKVNYRIGSGGEGRLSPSGVSPGAPRVEGATEFSKPLSPRRKAETMRGEMTADEVNARLEMEVSARERAGEAHYRRSSKRTSSFGDGGDDVPNSYSRRMLAAYKRAIPGNPLSSNAVSLVGMATRFLPEAVRPAAQAAGSMVGRAAMIYAIASGTAKILPEAMALGNQIAGDTPGLRSPDPRIDMLQDAVEKLRQAFAWIETRISGTIAAFQKQRDVNVAALRISGQLPTDNERLRTMFTEEERTTREVQAKFDMWKAREAPFATAQMLFDTFKRQLNR